MGKGLIVCLFFLMSGCVAFPQLERKLTRTETGAFHEALEPLLKKQDSRPIKTYIKENPDTLYASDAKLILQLQSRYQSSQKKLKTCEQQLDAAQVEIKKLRVETEKLQADIERLTQLHLKMGRNDQ
jgi:phage shock protein A